MSDAPELPADMTALLATVGAKRDRAAFEVVFLHFAPRVKSYLLRLGAGPALADDLAQEAMLAVWRKAVLFDPARASAATWIFTIARNLRIDAIRRERHPGFDPADPAFLPDDPVVADAALQAAQEAESLRRALEALPAEQGRIVTLSFFSGKPHGEIAAELGLPLGTVKSRIRLAMARLKSLLEEGP